MNDQLKYEKLNVQLKPYLNMMSKASDSIMVNDVSSYPIFVIHQSSLDIGLPLIDRETLGGKWSIHASTVEEFTTKQLIQSDKVDTFLQVFKDPSRFLCLFVVEEKSANFIFLPRPN